MTTYSLHHTPMFDDCLNDFVKRKDRNAIFDLQESLIELRRQPFQNPVLQTHPMQGVSGRKRYISDSGGRTGHRIIWTLMGREIVLLLFGEHDPVERRAARIDIDYDPAERRILVSEHEVVRESAAPEPSATGPTIGSLFVAWTDSELADFGFGSHVVPILRRMETDDDLFRAGLSDDDEERALNLLIYTNPEGEAAAQQTDERRREAEQAVEEALPEDEKAAARAVRSPASRKSVAPLGELDLTALFAEPIEEWMVFLHPHQAKLTQRPFSGPARVRGGAGTGKTVVALHRAKHLASTYQQPVLFTTYVKNLPPVFETLFQRLAPAQADLVDFRTLHSAAFQLLRQAGQNPSVTSKALTPAFSAAWSAVHRPGGDLDHLGLTREYLRTEIEWVIKGRGVTSLDAYLGLARTGRGTALPAAARHAVWELYEAYERELRSQRTIDFADLLSLAVRALEEGRATTPYRSVLVDEAQDLTEVGVRLAYLLAGEDQRDGLFLVGDGQQSIYPGGFSLGSLGIDVRGRANLLKVNYRNTRQVAAFAAALVAGSSFDDGDEGVAAEEGDRELDLVRDGTTPIMRAFATIDDHDIELAARIDELANRDDTSLGDIAVLVPTNRMVGEVTRVVQSLGLPVRKLEQYEGRPEEMVKVGTYQRGKGLEFKRVLLPRLDADGLGEAARPGEDEATHAERLELLRNALFVAVTRARDGVWGGWVGEPAALLRDAVASM